MLPLLEGFANAHGVSTPTVVADAAMLSRTLLEELAARGVSYIVDARLPSSPAATIAQVCDRSGQQDGGTVRIPSPHGQMIRAFSTARYKKDKANYEKLLAKAHRHLGVKGYCTNIPEKELDNTAVIAHYHDLWQVEKAFRMANTISHYGSG